MTKKTINILFDCDGTLVDSEHLYVHLLSEILMGMGYDRYTVEYCYQTFCGTNHHFIYNHLKSHHNNFDHDKFESVFMAQATEKAVKELKAVEGAHAILDKLASNRKCLVTNGFKEIVRFSLEITDLKKYFADESIFTVELVEHGKPQPDLYKLAMDTMGFDPEYSIAIEDSTVGATAAIAAGIRTIGFVNQEKQHLPYYIALEKNLREIGVEDIIYSLHEFEKYTS